jgi:arylsulfatase A-like enzyme
MLAEFMARHVGPEDHFVLLSDHGFERSPDGKDPSGEHTGRRSADAATWLLVGPRIRAGTRFEAAALVDVLPTLLELAGIPAASDLPGQVLGDVVSGAARERVAPYSRLARAAPAAPRADAEERARLERLKALGYLQGEGDR